MLCVCHTTPTQKLYCLHVFRQAEPPQRVDYWPFKMHDDQLVKASDLHVNIDKVAFISLLSYFEANLSELLQVYPWFYPNFRQNSNLGS